jgi:hypothetical protein
MAGVLPCASAQHVAAPLAGARRSGFNGAVVACRCVHTRAAAAAASLARCALALLRALPRRSCARALRAAACLGHAPAIARPQTRRAAPHLRLPPRFFNPSAHAHARSPAACAPASRAAAFVVRAGLSNESVNGTRTRAQMPRARASGARGSAHDAATQR